MNMGTLFSSLSIDVFLFLFLFLPFFFENSIERRGFDSISTISIEEIECL